MNRMGSQRALNPYPKQEGKYNSKDNIWVSGVAQWAPANAGDTEDTDSTPEFGRSPGAGNGSSFQYSCLENPMDRGIWQATVHGIAKHWTWMSD